jgi:hypothetical protein
MARGAEQVGLLNNDAVADPGWLAALAAVLAEHPVCGIATGKLLAADGVTLDSTGDFYTPYGWAFPRGRGLRDEGQYDIGGGSEVFAASGGASLLRVAMLERIGLFDEDFFAYYEDVDLSFRARLAGWTVRYTPDALALHRMGATSSRHGDLTRFHTTKNMVLLYAKNLPGPLAVRYLPRLLFGLAWQVAADVSGGRWRTPVRAGLAAARLLPTALRRRRTIQRSRVVPAATVNEWLWQGWPATMVPPGVRLRQRLSRTDKRRGHPVG